MAGVPDALREGDKICLYSEQASGYILAKQTSAVFSEIAVQKQANRGEPAVTDLQVITFEVLSSNRYKLNKAYRKFMIKHEGKKTEELDSSTLSKMHFYKKNAEAENEENRTEQEKHRGNPIFYGQIIQLRHEFTNKYIHVSTDKMARVEKTEMRIDLCEHNAKAAQFRLMPRYKVKSEGDIVQVGDQVMFESVKSTNQYLHTSHVCYDKDSVYAGMFELNLSVVSSGFSIMRRYQPKPDHEELIKNGATLRLFHKECEAYLCAEGLANWAMIQDVHLRIRPVDYTVPKTVFPSTSAINYWELQLQQNFLSGDITRWGQPCHLKHRLTERYLAIDSSAKRLITVNSRKDPNTVFRFHPVAKESDFVTVGTFCRIEHVLSGLWVHASGDEVKRDATTDGQLCWTSASMKKLGTSMEMQFADAFTLQTVEEENLQNCNFVLGMIPTLQKFAVDVKKKNYLSAKEAHDMACVMTELRRFMYNADGQADKCKQKLLRNCQVIEILVEVLKTKAIVVGNKKEQIIKVFREIYHLLETYLVGNSRKNELFLARYLPFFYDQTTIEGSVGRSAVCMITELVLDNRKIIDRISPEQIKKFVQQLAKSMDYAMLDLLGALCVCNGMPIPENQNIITDVWLQQTRSVYHTELGQNINLDKNVVYVSWDNRQTWLALHDFADRDDVLKKHREFLDHQLDLFGKLCTGRNQNVINVMTEQLNYLTWEEAFICLTDEQLPKALRAKYCELIIDLFVDVEGNTSFLDALELTFVYDDIGSPDGGRTVRVSEMSQFGQLLEQLQNWISYFLEKNKCMIASDIGENMLIEKVLELVHYLVKYGFYTRRDRLDSLLSPLISLLDGTNDLPYPMENKKVNPDIEDFQAMDRFKPSAQNTAVVNAKYQAMRVLDLFLNFRFNSRLHQFVALFKRTYESTNVPFSGTFGLNSSNSLAPLLSEDFELAAHKKLCSHALNDLEEIFKGTSILDSHNVTGILLDLSSYEYDRLVCKSMSLLTRYHSAHENVFARAIQAQVLITDESCDVYKELEELVPVFRKLSSSTLDARQTTTAIDILDRFIDLCWCGKESERTQVHTINQVILYNYGVISDVFEVLTHRIDQELQYMYMGLQKVIQRCCTFLQVMARDNAQVQSRLFDRLDLLLSVRGAHEQLALTLAEIFTGNKGNCMRVHFQHIKKMVELTAEYGQDAAQYTELLRAIVKIEELDLPLKRNQDYVMKYFTQNRQAFAEVLDCSPETRRSLLLAQGAQCEYTVALIDLLAACAEGENKFIESLCQNILKIPEILDVLADKDIAYYIKRAYCKFLLWVYVKTGVEDLEVGALANDPRLWEYLETVQEDLVVMSDVCSKTPNVVERILMSRHYDVTSHEEHEIRAHHLLHYLCDGALPFVEVFFQNEYPKFTYGSDLDIDLKAEIEHIAKRLQHFSECVLPLVTRPLVQRSILSCARAVLPLSSMPGLALDTLESKYETRTADRMKTQAQKKFERYYQGEIELNNQFNLFARNYCTVFGGENTVHAQIGFKSDKEYTEVGQDEDLPLGPEFQQLVSCFIDSTTNVPSVKYRRAAKLLKQLQISATRKQSNERKRLEQQTLDIKCLQCLRGLLHNEIVKLPRAWIDNLNGCQAQMKKIEQLQNVLDEMGAMRKIVVHLNSGVTEQIIQEALALMVSMLFAGNEQVQGSLMQYFKTTKEERFFVTIRNRMATAALAVKERRALLTQHQSVIQEAIDQIKGLKAAHRDGTIDRNEISTQMGSTMFKARSNLRKRAGDKSLLGASMALNASRMTMNPRSSRGISSTRVNKSRASMTLNVTRQMDALMAMGEGEATQSEIDVEDVDESQLEERLYAMWMQENEGEAGHSDGYMTLMLRLMGLMCDGQHDFHQDYMREQSDNFLSCDLVGETTRFLSFVYSNISTHNVELITELLQALVEFVSGNYKNQIVVFDNKLCDYLDFILQGSPYVGCSVIEIFEVKKTMACLIRALTEENPPPDANINLPKVVMTALEPRSIASIVQDSFNKHKDKKLGEEARNLALNVAFSYFHILMRMVELRPEGRRLLKGTSLNDNTLKWLEQHTLSVEVVKDNRLHKVHYPIQIRNALRDAVKESFNYEVDRTASERINDFMDHVPDLKQDIAYTRRVLSNKVTKALCRIWFPANVLMIFLSFVFLVVMSVTWRAPEKSNNYVPEYHYNRPIVRAVLFVLSILHIIATSCVLTSYMIINRPKGPGEKLNNLCEKFGMSRPFPEGEGDCGHMRVHFFSIRTFWYISMLVASVLGLFFYHYFYAYHLLHIAEFNQLVNRAIKAVTKNGQSLILIFIFGFILIFIFAQVNFAFYRELFQDPESTGLYCTRMYECMTTVFHRGLIVSLYEGVAPEEGRRSTFYYHKALTDLLFFMVITVVGLDIIFGMVVDTFAELRDSKWNAEKEMIASCFICGIESYAFEKKPGGFERHVKHEHNQWSYVYFFMHLDGKRPNDYSALELYVCRMLASENTEFIPKDRALCLESEVDENQEKINLLQQQLDYLVSRVKQIEFEKMKASEKQQLVRWESKYRKSSTSSSVTKQSSKAAKPPKGEGARRDSKKEK